MSGAGESAGAASGQSSGGSSGAAAGGGPLRAGPRGRLRSSAQTDPELASALDGLIPAVDRALYAPKEKPALFPQARLVRRRVGASVRRQFLREGLSRVKKRLPSGG